MIRDSNQPIDPSDLQAHPRKHGPGRGARTGTDPPRRHAVTPATRRVAYYACHPFPQEEMPMTRKVHTEGTEEDYVRLVPPHLYISVEAATKICKLVECDYHLVPMDSLASAPALETLYAEAGIRMPDGTEDWNAGVIPAPKRKTIWQRVDHGKYAGVGALFDEVSHLFLYGALGDDPAEVLAHHDVNEKGLSYSKAFVHYGRRLQALDPDWEGAPWPEIPF